MSDFKKGDVVECVDRNRYAFISVGARYEVLGTDVDGDPVIVNESDVVRGYNSTFFKLVDYNPMPDLEAGMVIGVVGDIAKGGKYLHVEENRNYRIGELETGFCYTLHELGAIVTIYKSTQCGIHRDHAVGDLVWSKTPPETEQQKRLRELKELATETSKKIAELEEVM